MQYSNARLHPCSPQRACVSTHLFMTLTNWSIFIRPQQARSSCNSGPSPRYRQTSIERTARDGAGDVDSKAHGATAPRTSGCRHWNSCSAWPHWCRGRAGARGGARAGKRRERDAGIHVRLITAGDPRPAPVQPGSPPCFPVCFQLAANEFAAVTQRSGAVLLRLPAP